MTVGWRCCLRRALFALALAAFAFPAFGLSESKVCEGIKATLHDPSRVDPGYLFWHQSDELKLDVDNVSLLADARGNVVHTWPTNLTGGGTPAYLLPNGRVLRTGVKDRASTRGGPVASTDAIQIVEPDGEIVWELSSEQFPDTLFHHDVEYLDNGHLLVTTYRRLDAEAALARGWDPEGRGEVWADGVLEIRPDLASGEATVVWAWSFADHLIQDRFPEKPNFGVIADHPDRIDPHYPDSYAPMNVVRQHVNSVDYHEALDQILLSSFIYNEIWIIDRSGRIVFRWGNPAAYQRGSPEDRVLLRQHDANWIDAGLRGAGNILIHNNNVQFRPRPPSDREPDNGQPRTFMDNLEVDAGVSGVYELRVAPAPDGSYGDRPGSPFAAEVVWRWEHESYFADFQGSARRLGNGNTLMTDTTDHLAVEVTRDGVIVAEYQGCAPAYKTYKYDRDFVARVINADHEEPR